MIKFIIVAITMVTSLTLLACSDEENASEPDRSTRGTPTTTETSATSGRSPEASSPAVISDGDETEHATPTTTAVPVQTLPTGTRVLPVGSPGAATALQATTECTTQVDGAAALLGWTSAAPAGSEQRIALTIFAEGFETGNFNVSEPLAPDRTSYRWTPLSGQAIHSWRVLTLQPDGWAPSETSTFQGPSCPVDIS